MIIADENINHRIILEIRKIPLNVISIQEEYSGISDEEVIEFSKNPPRLIITEDKDFGEWVFAHDVRDISVIFLRYHHSQLIEIISILVSLLKQNLTQLFGKFTTITTKKIRTRIL